MSPRVGGGARRGGVARRGRAAQHRAGGRLRKRPGKHARTRAGGRAARVVRAAPRKPGPPRIDARPDMLEVRRSPLHGQGVFALRRIRKGTRVIEYLGDRVSHREADRRYESKDSEDGHTFLFIVDRGVVVDGGSNGNEARFINHSCDPNCESTIEDRRIFIEAIRTVQPGEELTYDYQIGRDRDDPPNVDEVFACRCGAANCRGSMLWPPKRQPRKAGAARKPRSSRRRRRTASRPAAAGGARESRA